MRWFPTVCKGRFVHRRSSQWSTSFLFRSPLKKRVRYSMSDFLHPDTVTRRLQHVFGIPFSQQISTLDGIDCGEILVPLTAPPPPLLALLTGPLYWSSSHWASLTCIPFPVFPCWFPFIDLPYLHWAPFYWSPLLVQYSTESLRTR